jgi:hypothetical protein
MSEKRMLVIDADVVSRMDENRGDLSHSEFINFLIDSCLKEDSAAKQEDNSYISREEFIQFQQGTKELLRSFLEFFISFGMELGKQPSDSAFGELTKKLQSLATEGKRDTPACYIPPPPHPLPTRSPFSYVQ